MDSDQAHAIINFGFEVGYLKRLPRAGWQFAGVARPETVAEHSFRVGVLAYLIASTENANADRAAVLGLFHDIPETRITDVPMVSRPHLGRPDPRGVIRDQTVGLPADLSEHIIALITQHETYRLPRGASPEALCSADADKLDCLLQAKEYEAAGNTQMETWITSSLAAMRTTTGKQLANAALADAPSQWWAKAQEKYIAAVANR